MGDSGARIEPFVLLARSTKGAAAAKVIADATAAPGVYTFTELLNVPNIQSLRSDPSSSKSVALLDLFAYGTFQTYKENADAIPPLTPPQLQKLKQLTLVSLALQHRSLSYDQLLTALDVASVRDLEDLIIDTIYAGLLTGKMHHHERILHVDWVAGRDLRPEDLQIIRQGLENWCATASTLLKALDEQIARVRQASADEATTTQLYEAERNAIVETLMNSKTSSGKGHSLRGHDVYDMTQDEDAVMNGSASGSGPGGFSGLLSGIGAGSGGRKLGLSRKGQGSAGSEELGRRGVKRLKDSP